MFVGSKDFNIPDDQDNRSFESFTNPFHSLLCKFKEENGFDDENDLKMSQKRPGGQRQKSI